MVLDISDMARPRMLSRWDYHPPYPGFTHTLLPLFDQGKDFGRNGRGLRLQVDQRLYRHRHRRHLLK